MAQSSGTTAGSNATTGDPGDTSFNPAAAPSERAVDASRATRTSERARDQSDPADPARRSEQRDRIAQNFIRPSKRPERQPVRPEPPITQNQKRGRSRAEKAAAPDTEDDRQKPATPSPSSAPSESPSSRDRYAVPPEIDKRFIRVGKQYHFADGAHAFTDRGSCITTRSENTEVIKSLIAIAKARGWDDITVGGTERFRKEAWFAAKLAGLEVRGFRPNGFEQARLARAMARQKGGPEEEGERRLAFKQRDRAARDPGAHRAGLVTGRLIDHGPAPYLHDYHEPMSYFVKIETRNGEQELWGVDLERAFKESLTKPNIGDEVGLRSIRQDAVTVKSRERDAQGNIMGKKKLTAHRNYWIVERREFFDARADPARVVRNPTIKPDEAVKAHPTLAGTYHQLRAAELVAQRLRDPEDQSRFLNLVRRAMADSVARGEPLEPVRLKEPAAARAESPPTRKPPIPERQAPVRG